MSSAGTVRTYLACVPSGTPGSFVSDQCGIDPATGLPLAVMPVQGYIIDVSNAPYFDGVVQPIDYFAAGALWSLGFTFVVGLYFFSRGLGAFLSMIRR